MTDYYLLAFFDYPNNLSFERAKVRKLTDVTRKQALAAAKDYERELNNGELWDINKVAHGTPMNKVDVLPFSEARNYRDFADWSCNLEEDPRDAS